MDRTMAITRKKGNASEADAIACIPQLFKPAAKGFIPINLKDPFIDSPEIFQRYCKHASEETAESRKITNIFKLSDARMKKAAQIQMANEKRLLEEEQQEKEKEAQKKAVEQRIKQNLDRKVDRVFKEHKFFVKKQCPVLIPYKSSLNHAEHEAYLRAFVKFKIRQPKTACEAAEYEQYLRLQNRVFEEQKLFMDFSFQVSRLQLDSYNGVPKLVDEYVHSYVQHRAKQAARYKPTYLHEQQVPIRPQDPTNRFSNLHFKHLGHLLSLGSVPWLKLPNNHKLTKLAIDDSVLEAQPPVPTARDDTDSNLSRGSVSEDPNAEYLARKHSASIVICTSALKTIADNPGPNFDKEWDIPMRVRSFAVEDEGSGERTHRVVFIDKPMPKKVWTPLEKKQLFYKKCALASLTEIKRLNAFKMRTPPVFRYQVADAKVPENKDAVDYTEDFLDLTSTADHDVFGIDTMETTSSGESPSKIRKMAEEDRLAIKPTKSSKKKKGNPRQPDQDVCKRKEATSSLAQSGLRGEESDAAVGSSKGATSLRARVANEEEKTNSFLEDLIDLQDSLLKPLQSSDSPEKDKDSDAKKDPRLCWPWANTLSTDWTDHIEAKGCELWSGRNKHYQLFSMGIGSSQPNSSPSQDLRIIVRHNVHGISRLKKQKIRSKAFVVTPKIENQPYFGCEVNTCSEITRQWVNLVAAPNAALMQVRVCEGSGEVMMTEEKTLEDLLKDGKQPHIGFQPQQVLVSWYAVFTAARGLPAGDYLLHHDDKTKAFLQLLKAPVDGAEGERLGHHQSSFRFHSAYTSASAPTKNFSMPPWLAIDTHLMTPFHTKHLKIPGTFPMENPNKKLTKTQKKLILDKSKKKKKLADLDQPEVEGSEDQMNY